MNKTMPQGLFEQELPYPASVTALYRRLRRFPLPVLLASGSNAGFGARYDILSAAPTRIFRTQGMQTRIKHSEGPAETCAGNPIELLGQHFDYPRLDFKKPSHYPFVGGAIGYFAYDLLHPYMKVAPVTRNDIAMPGMLVGIYHWSLIVDHKLKQCHFVALPSCPAPLRDALLDSLVQEQDNEAAEAGFALQSEFQSNFSKDQYLDAFDKIIDYIHAGDCYQVNLAQRFSAHFSGDPLAAFERLQTLANAPFAAYIEDEQGQVLSFSPERFIQVRAGKVLTQPIKGTRPRHSNPEQDRQLKADLASSIKDRAENLMIVDLLRNDLGRVCETASVRVPSLFEVQSFRNVHHLVSSVEGRLARPEDVFRLLESSFPGGSITGAPKLRAMEIINEVETRSRSVYCGSFAYIGFDGSMDSNICIRTLVCADKQIHCWGGGGIVADSQGDQEYQETLDKISIFISNLA